VTGSDPTPLLRDAQRNEIFEGIEKARLNLQCIRSDG
jgi:hypothetical protein